MKRIIIIIFLVFLILSLNVYVRIFNLSKILQNRFFALKTREFASKNVSRIVRPKTHEWQRMQNKLTRWRQIEGLSSWTTPQPSAESSFTSLYLCYSQIHRLIQLNCTRHKAITAITRFGKLTLWTDVTWRHQPVFDPLLVPSFWAISEAEQEVFGRPKFKKCFGRGLSKDQNQF